MMTKAMLVVNPSSGGEKARTFQQQAVDVLSKKFDEIIVKETQGAGDATRFGKEACQEHYEAFFVMGGDGTVNEGISGLAEQDYRPKFGFFPLGTVNDLARALGIPVNPAAAIAAMENTRMQPLDIGKINDHYFMNVVALGTLPEGLNQVESEDKTKLGKLAYGLAGMRALRDTESYKFHIQIDDEELTLTTTLILVGLTNSIGGFEHIIDRAEVDDGKLHFIALQADNLMEKLKVLPKVLSGELTEHENIFYREFESAHIELVDADNQVFSANVDGDRDDHLPLDLKVLHNHLDVYVPQED